jgi:toxin ParE1/3/4
MSRIERTTRARNDAAEIWFYIAQDNDAAADTLLDHIDERIKSLARMPLSAEAADFVRPGVRRSSLGNYVIYYWPIDEGIEVLRILHGARDPKGLV